MITLRQSGCSQLCWVSNVSQALEQQAAQAQVLFLDPILGFEKFTARLKRLLRGFVEALPLRLAVLARAFAQGPPLFLQLLDVPGKRGRMQRRADQRFHAFNELDALGRDRKALPILQLLQLFIELAELIGEVRRQVGCMGQLVFDAPTQAGRRLAAAGGRAPVRLADQAADLAQGFCFGLVLLDVALVLDFLDVGAFSSSGQQRPSRPAPVATGPERAALAAASWRAASAAICRKC